MKAGWTIRESLDFKGALPKPLSPLSGDFRAKIVQTVLKDSKGRPGVQLSLEVYEDRDGEKLKPVRKVTCYMCMW